MKDEKAENKSSGSSPQKDNKQPFDDEDYGDEYDHDEGDDEGEGLMDDPLADDANGSDQYEAYSDPDKDYNYKKQLEDYYNKSDGDMEGNLDEEGESDLNDNYLKQKNHIDQLK